MSTIDKIKEVLRVKQLNPTRAERAMGVSQGTLAKAFQRGGGIHESTAEKFIVTFHVARLWWDTGKGEMFEQNPTSVTKVEEPLKPYPELMELMQKLHESDEREIKRLTRDVERLTKELEECRRGTRAGRGASN